MSAKRALCICTGRFVVGLPGRRVSLPMEFAPSPEKMDRYPFSRFEAMSFTQSSSCLSIPIVSRLDLP